MGLYDEGKQKPWHEDPWGAAKRGLGWVKDKVTGAADSLGDKLGEDPADTQFKADGRNNFRQQGAMSHDVYQAMADQASGKTSVSREMLRQGLQQQYGQQRSMAAGASPQNASMAALAAAQNMGRASTGMSGQAAQAAMQEQMAARRAQGEFLQRWRDQELSAAQGGGPDKTWVEKYGPAISAGAGLVAMSDRTLKTEIKDGDSKAGKALERLKSFSYKYKDEKHGKGTQFGVMAQDLEKAGLGHAVIDTPNGKAVHGAKAALSSLALAAALAKRVAKLEGKKK